MEKGKKMFFGWENFKWLFKELIKMYSSQNAFFSKKRIESGIAFAVLQWGMIYWLKLNILNISVSDLCMWAGVEAVICGYTLNLIEKQDAKKSADLVAKGEVAEKITDETIL